VRVVALLCLLAGCDSIWDVEHVERPDASQLPADLAAYFPMERADDGTLTDVAGPHDGICMSGECPTSERGVVDDALRFDGMTQVVNAQSSAALDTAGSFTVALWVRMDAAAATGTACPVNKLYFGTQTDNAWQFCAYMGTWHFLAYPIEGAGPAIELGKWQHLAATWEQASGKLQTYQNGFVVGTPVIGQPLFGEGRLVIGADVDTGQTLVHFPGAIDDVRIYTRALDANEVLMLVTP
jgi:hypothetical protein